MSSLLSQNRAFTRDVFRAFQTHVFGREWTPTGCEVENCWVQPQWFDPNEVLEIPPSQYAKSNASETSTEVHEITISDEEEEALADSEREEAVAEADEVKEELLKAEGM